MAEAFFRVFDEDNSGALNFYEYMMVKNAPDLNSPEQKIDWIFTAFDQDDGGTIDVDEVYEIVVALFKMAGKGITGILSETEIEVCVDDIIEAVDADGDGVITKEEFVQNAMSSDFIFNIFHTSKMS